MPIASVLVNSRYKFYKFCDMIGLLKYFNINSSIILNNTKIILPVKNAFGYQNLVQSEKWAYKLYEKLLSILPGVFIDVGVNNAQTLIKIKSIDTNRHYIGFEPNPVCYCYSRSLILQNNFNNCILFPAGLGNKNEILPLFHDTEFASGGTIIPNFRENSERYNKIQQVVIMEGDNIILKQKLENISVLKVDVEGAEYEVIHGLSKTIEKFKPVLFLEFLPVYTLEKLNGQLRFDRQQKLIDLLFTHGYTMYRIDEVRLSLIQLNEIEIHSEMNKTNYLFVPIDKKKMIENLF